MREIQSAMAVMFEHAKDRLTSAELEPLTSFSELAADEARRLSGVCEELGCLISSDGNENCNTRVGNFQSTESVSRLLFSLAHSFDAIAAMAQIGDEATHESNRRMLCEQHGVKPSAPN